MAAMPRVMPRACCKPSGLETVETNAMATNFCTISMKTFLPKAYFDSKSLAPSKILSDAATSCRVHLSISISLMALHRKIRAC
eukprot:CAMPEP_0181480818 /NCGR_PEP_ID=MMETSP1110-20121109/43997_1 /TAXON_ID=174948 /ORGANISM="Symbiodinium sp., Strain CCMP421" /LENGTH=82 /DNA_ID=CAMNT_0023606301 /DNA_START=139 /DNA_END=387 /DNA_ORIENTATION=-